MTECHYGPGPHPDAPKRRRRSRPITTIPAVRRLLLKVAHGNYSEAQLRRIVAGWWRDLDRLTQRKRRAR